MTPEERIEAVAQAIYAEAQNGEYVGWRRDWPDVTLDGQFDLKAFAKAAILATLQSLLEPSEAMAEEGRLSVETWVDPKTAAEDAWQCMIRQAIKEH
jgi:hypothetical protein